MIKNFDIEESFPNPVIGIDEVGRGPLAGPVVAGAIVIDKAALTLGLNDSKKLSAKKREVIFESLINNYQYGIGVVEAEEIDEIGITKATFKAMKEAASPFRHEKYIVLVDGNQKPFSGSHVHTLVKGDAKAASVAAASIIAKVTRDKIMRDVSILHPYFEWHKNFGYGTKFHMQAIRDYGVTAYHRKSFLKFLNQDNQLSMNLDLKFRKK